MKKHSFSKKLISLFLAVVMALSCFTAVLNAYAASADTEGNLYEANNSYNALGWVETTDEQKLSAILDLADEFLASMQIPTMDISLVQLLRDAGLGALVDLNLVGGPDVHIELSSVDGALKSLASLENLIRGLYVTGVVDKEASLKYINHINLNGVYKDYVTTGNAGNRVVMSRENSTSKEIVKGLLNCIYMNTNDRAGYAIIQQAIGPKDGLIFRIKDNGIVTYYTLDAYSMFLNGMIAPLIGFTPETLPENWHYNLVNNVLVAVLKDSVIKPLITDEATGQFPTRIDTSKETWNFIDDAGIAMSLEEIVCEILNKLVFPSILNVEGKPVFDSNHKLEYTVNDKLMSKSMDIVKGVMDNVLAPLFGTISIDFGYIPNLTRMYTEWRMEQADKPTSYSQAGTYWTRSYVREWIQKDTKNIASYLMTIQDYDGTYLCPGIDENSTYQQVETAMVNLFNHLDRVGADGVDLTYVFTNMLYSPVAAALGCPTGMLNLTIRDSYFGMYRDKYESVKGSIYKTDAISTVYPLIHSLAGELFPTFDGFEADASSETLYSLVTKLVSVAGKLVTEVADNANAGILKEFHDKGGVYLNETNIETAVAPLMIGAVMHAETFSQIHAETWNSIDDLNGLFYVLMVEYLKSVLPEYDYSKLPGTKANGKLDVSLENVLLPMARDIIAVIGQGMVPMGWDVFTQGGTDANGNVRNKDFTVWNLVNNVVCYFTDHLGIANIFGLTKYCVYGYGSTTESAINSGNDLWTNLDLIVNTLMPTFGSLFEDAKGQFKSKDLFYYGILNALLNIEDQVQGKYGRGMSGLSSVIYNIGYVILESAPLNKTRVITVLYDFIRELINAVLAPRTSDDPYTKEVIPANDGTRPVTDLIQGKVLWGQYGVGEPSYSMNIDRNGILGVAVARFVQATGGSDRWVTNTDTVIPGLTNILYIVNALITFVPTLGHSTLRGINATFTQDVFNNYVHDPAVLDGVYLGVENLSAGIKRAIMTKEGTKDHTTIDRYFVQVKSIDGVENISVDASTCYDYDGFNGTYIPTDNLIKPGEKNYFKVSGYPNQYGTKEFKITYKIVDKNGNLYQDYDNLTTYAYMAFSDNTTFFDELYVMNEAGDNVIFNGKYVNGLSEGGSTKFENGENAVSATDAFAGNLWGSSAEGMISVAHPSKLVVDTTAAESLSDMKLGIKNTGEYGADPSYLNIYPIVERNGEKKIPVACDKDGNLIDYSQGMEYYHPISKTWDKEQVIQRTINGIVKDFYFTESRWQVTYTADEARGFAGYEPDIENGVVYLTYCPNVAEMLPNVSCVSPIKGTYIKASNLTVEQADTYNTNVYSWIHQIPGASVEVPNGRTTVTLGVGYTNDNTWELAGSDAPVEIEIPAFSQSYEKRSECGSKLSEARDFVDAHYASDFVDGNALNKVHEEIRNTYLLLNSTMPHNVTDVTLEQAIKNLNDAMDAEIRTENGVKVDYPNKLAREVVDNFNGLSAYDYGNINYNLTRNIKELAWNVLSREYENPNFVQVTEKDEDFSSLNTYVFKNSKGETVDEAMYTTFLIRLGAGMYEEVYGLKADAVAGVDYTFGFIEPELDEWGSPKYIYSSSASIAEMREIIRLYNLYKNTITTRTYADNDTTILNEIKCATGLTADQLTVSNGEVLVSGTPKVKYGVVAGGKIVNEGVPRYTEESWADYIDALAAAVQATKDQNGMVSELDALRLNVMYAENNLEETAIVNYDTWTFVYASGKTETQKVVEGGQPTMPENSEQKLEQLNTRQHNVTTYSWSLTADKTYTEVGTTNPVNHTPWGSLPEVITEPTRTETGYSEWICECGRSMRKSNYTVPTGVKITTEVDVNDVDLGTATITGTTQVVSNPARDQVTDVAIVDANAVGTTSVKYASLYTLKAVPNANAKFIGWYDGHKLISTEEEYETYAYADLTYRAVFQEIEDNSFTVTFMGCYGNIIDEINSNDLKNFNTMPTAPEGYVGRTFAGWSHTVDEIKNLTEATIVYALYEKDTTPKYNISANGCDITVNGETVQNLAKAPYDAKVTVSSTSEKATIWYLNGAWAGMGETLTFYCGGDSVITYETGEFGADELEPYIALLNETEDPVTRRVTFLGTRVVPEQYTLIESGFIYGKGMAEEDLVLENVGMVKGSANGKVVLLKNVDMAPEGQFSITFGVTGQTAPASARAYLIYADADGTTHVVYSDAMIHTFK